MVASGEVDGLRGLVQSGGDVRALVNEVDEAGYSPLYNAVNAAEPNIEIVRVLLTAGADPKFAKVTHHPGYEMPKEFLADLPEEMRDLMGSAPPRVFREPLLKVAFTGGSVELVQLLAEHGLDLAEEDENRYTSVFTAIHGPGDRLPILRYLIGLGLPVDQETTYGESAIRSAYHFINFGVVEELLRAGADEGRLKWSPLHRALSLGTMEDLKSELRNSTDLEARDVWDRTPFLLSLLKGDIEAAQLLAEHGADIFASGQKSASICYAVESGNVALVRWLVERGCSIESTNYLDHTCLTLAAELGNREMVQTLLELGANPNVEDSFSSPLRNAANREIVLLLIDHGADTGDLDDEGRRKLLGLGEDLRASLDSVTRAEYLAGKDPKEGRGNPEDMTDPYRLAMIRNGRWAYAARQAFEDDPVFACGLKGRQHSPVWCFSRFGQSTTILPDGRVILIAGEHEDSYDPDFCIYNDVVVFRPEGDIRIYGYPYEVFPPTDFHSATLVGPDIYIVGSLGYMGERTAAVPVYRLSTVDFRIERVSTSGDSPGRVYRHRASLVGTGRIRVEGGTVISFGKKEENHVVNPDVFELDLETMVWARV